MRLDLCMQIARDGSKWIVRDVEKDIAAVEETLLAFVAQACPENDSRASLLGAAQSLIQYARSTHAEGAQHTHRSREEKISDSYPPDVLHSCSMLQPLLGHEGVSDAMTVLKALYYQKQRLEAGSQAELQAPCSPSEPTSPQQQPGSGNELPVTAETTGSGAAGSSEASNVKFSEHELLNKETCPADSVSDSPQQSAQQGLQSVDARKDEAINTGAPTSPAQPQQDGAKVCSKLARAPRYLS